MDFRKELTAISLVAIFMYNSNCFAQESKPSMKMVFGKGIQFTSSDSLFTMALSGRIQSLFEAKNDLTNETVYSDESEPPIPVQSGPLVEVFFLDDLNVIQRY
jgi:hypothetical protein